MEKSGRGGKKGGRLPFASSIMPPAYPPLPRSLLLSFSSFSPSTKRTRIVRVYFPSRDRETIYHSNCAFYATSPAALAGLALSLYVRLPDPYPRVPDPEPPRGEGEQEGRTEGTKVLFARNPSAKAH